MEATTSLASNIESPRPRFSRFSRLGVALMVGCFVCFGIVELFQLLERSPAIWTAQTIAILAMSLLVLPFALLTGLLLRNLVRWMRPFRGSSAAMTLPELVEARNSPGASQ
ncbi:MAG: hypothetical protein ABJM29_03335 [Rhizobiaceae bacterium]